MMLRVERVVSSSLVPPSFQMIVLDVAYNQDKKDWDMEIYPVLAIESRIEDFYSSEQTGPILPPKGGDSPISWERNGWKHHRFASIRPIIFSDGEFCSPGDFDCFPLNIVRAFVFPKGTYDPVMIACWRQELEKEIRLKNPDAFPIVMPNP